MPLEWLARRVTYTPSDDRVQEVVRFRAWPHGEKVPDCTLLGISDAQTNLLVKARGFLFLEGHADVAHEPTVHEKSMRCKPVIVELLDLEHATNVQGDLERVRQSTGKRLRHLHEDALDLRQVRGPPEDRASVPTKVRFLAHPGDHGANERSPSVSPVVVPLQQIAEPRPDVGDLFVAGGRRLAHAWPASYIDLHHRRHLTLCGQGCAPGSSDRPSRPCSCAPLS